MNILYGITTSNWGGAQAHLFELIKYFSNDKRNVVSLIVGSEGELTDRVRDMAGQGCHIYIVNDMVRQISPRHDFKAALKIRSIIKKTSPDIVHFHSSKAGALGRIASIGLDVKVVFTAHGWSFTEGVAERRRRIYVFIERVLARFSNKILCVSQYDYNLAIKENVLSANSSKGIVVYNGVSGLNSQNTPTQRAGKDSKALMVARFDEHQKRQDILVNALASIPPLDRPQVTLIGDGPKLDSVRKLVKQVGLESWVTFEGFKNNVIEYLNQSDFFLLITDYEGLPISIIEALSVGLPVIASDVGGVREEVVNDVNGFLVQNNINDIASAIKTMAVSPQKRESMGNNSLELFTSQFNINACVEKVAGVYSELMGSNKGGR